MGNIGKLLLALVTGLPLAASAQSGWRQIDGTPIAETEARQSRDGFSAALVLTPDQDWQAKWDTPPETIPHFSEADEVHAGGELFLLTFLSNPGLDKARSTDVTCDVTMTRPDGSTSLAQADIPCFRVTLPGNPENVYLTGLVMKYVAEPADPRGTWTVEVVVTDHHRGVSLPLGASFLVR